MAEVRHVGSIGQMSVPQFLSIMTIGVRDLASLRRFYRGWGWDELDASSDNWCAFDVGGCLLSLYPLDLLGDEAAPDEAAIGSEWRGFTLAINLPDEASLRRAFDAALAAGATLVADLTPRVWGGVSGYVADPEGNRWELATGGPNPVGG